MDLIASSAAILREAIEEFSPTHIVSMVSGGMDSAASDQIARELCRSGECMCGTMQTLQERAEAKAIYPEWGRWMDELEAEVRKRHGFGWGEAFPKPVDTRQASLPLDFQPMCKDCLREDV